MSDEVKVLHQWTEHNGGKSRVALLRGRCLKSVSIADEWTPWVEVDLTGYREIARLASLVAERDRELAAAKERIGKLEGELRDERRGPCGLSAGFER